MTPNFEFCRQPGAAVIRYDGDPGGIVRIATNRIFAVKCVAGQALAAAFPEMA
jgi:hypothetical protein